MSLNFGKNIEARERWLPALQAGERNGKRQEQ